MSKAIRLFLAFEAAAFLIASPIHSGYLVSGYAHPRARIEEGVIAVVLPVGLVCTWVRSAWTRRAGLAAQGLALLGTLVGAFTIAIGVGPRTVPDIIYHVTILIVLALGLVVAARARPDAPERAN